MSEKSIINFATHLIKIRKILLSSFDESEGEKYFRSLTQLLQLNIRTRTIIFEIDNLCELYSTELFKATTCFYSKKYEVNYDSSSIELIEEVNKINGNPHHVISDEVTLLYYVGLYHKIENYENEILYFYNQMNGTNFKSLKSIGIETDNKTSLFSDRDRIRLICNSIKHNNYFPKVDLLKFYPNLKIEKKISLNDFNPIADSELIKLYVKHFNFLAVFKSSIHILFALNNLGLASLESFNKSFDEFLSTEDYNTQKIKFSHLK